MLYEVGMVSLIHVSPEKYWTSLNCSSPSSANTYNDKTQTEIKCARINKSTYKRVATLFIIHSSHDQRSKAIKPPFQRHSSNKQSIKLAATGPAYAGGDGDLPTANGHIMRRGALAVRQASWSIAFACARLES